MKNELFVGSICLSDIPKEVMKKVERKDGSTGIYLNIAIVPRKEVGQFGHTHFVSCSPKQEERKEGVKYIIGDVKPLERKGGVSVEDIDNAPSVEDSDLPF